MKVCSKCGDEISGGDGVNSCPRCKVKKADRAKVRKQRDEMMRSLGLVKVRGALGGVYWE